jgi:general secretion pathway protein G
MMTGTVKKGFSLIEILIAVTIMGILAVGAISFLGGQVEKAKKTSTVSTLQVVDGAIDTYYLDIGRYPESLADLSRKPYDEVAAKNWTQPYFKQAQKDPDYMPVDGWKREIQYRLNEPGTSPRYEIYSFGPNGEDSPDDEWIYAQ